MKNTVWLVSRVLAVTALLFASANAVAYQAFTKWKVHQSANAWGMTMEQACKAFEPELRALRVGTFRRGRKVVSDVRTQYHPADSYQTHRCEFFELVSWDGNPPYETGPGMYFFTYKPTCFSNDVYDINTQQCVPNNQEDPLKNSGDCDTGKAMVGNPVNAGTGNKYQLETDYIDSASALLTFQRFYNSQIQQNEPLVAHWSHNFQQSISLTSNGNSLLAVRPRGQAIAFHLNAGIWTPGTDVRGSLTRLLDGSGNPDGWSYLTADNQTEIYDVAGKLVSITSSSGQVYTLAYDTSDRLVSVTDANSRALTFGYGFSQRLETMTDPAGGVYSYSYNSDGLLSSVSYPDDTPADPNDNPVRTYHYENTSYPTALTGITDEKNVRFATWVYDSQGRAISSEHSGNTDKVTLDYTHIDDVTDPRVTVTNALGKQTTYHFTTINGVRKVTQVEGHQSTHCAAANMAYTYDANGFLASSTDWLGRLTNYTRNAKGQELTRTEAVGTTEEQSFTTQWHATLNLPTKITALGYEIVYSYDANGNLLSKQLNDLTVP